VAAERAVARMQPYRVVEPRALPAVSVVSTACKPSVLGFILPPSTTYRNDRPSQMWAPSTRCRRAATVRDGRGCLTVHGDRAESRRHRVRECAQCACSERRRAVAAPSFRQHACAGTGRRRRGSSGLCASQAAHRTCVGVEPRHRTEAQEARPAFVNGARRACAPMRSVCALAAPPSSARA